MEAVVSVERPAPNSSGSVVPVVKLICTDRGQHEWTDICDFRIGDDGGFGIRVYSSVTPPNSYAKPGEGSRHSYTFICSKCTRRPRVHLNRVIKEVKAAAAGNGLIEMSLTFS
jgi:hypothetical protein